jgi:hypothetical protein
MAQPAREETGGLHGRYQIPQAGGDELRIAKLAQRIGRASVRHRCAGIEHDMRPQIRRYFILLDVIAFALGISAPVQPLDVITGRVLAVLGKIQRKAHVRRAVHPLHVPVHHLPRHQLDPRDPLQRMRIEERSG